MRAAEVREALSGVCDEAVWLEPLRARLEPGSRVVSAMSGGVDSSVATALLVAAGFDVLGVSMRLGNSAPRADGHSGCCSLDDFDDARRVSERLGVAHYVVDLRRTFEERVLTPFVETYLRGRTPNPCTLCNRDVKFDAFHEYAHTAGAVAVATGHYCRIESDGNSFSLLAGRDPAKDQSYFLFTMGQSELAATLFPVGDLDKDTVRAMAAALDLPVAKKAESQDICFVAGRSYIDVVEERAAPDAIRPGRILDNAGRELGRHDGIHRFTIGQRRGVPGGMPEKFFVTAIDADSGDVTVGPAAALEQRSLVVEGVCWTGHEFAGAAEVRLRHRHDPVPCRIEPAGEGAVVELPGGACGITPGQAAVWYDGPRVLGGGWIANR